MLLLARNVLFQSLFCWNSFSDYSRVKYIPIFHTNTPIQEEPNMPTSKKKTEKIDGVKKHNELVRAKKQATKERKAVALPAGYKKKK